MHILVLNGLKLLSQWAHSRNEDRSLDILLASSIHLPAEAGKKKAQHFPLHSGILPLSSMKHLVTVEILLLISLTWSLSFPKPEALY